MTDTDIPQQENKDSSYSTNQAERKIMDTTSELREAIADAIRNNSHYEVAETPVINAVMKVVATQKQRWEAEFVEVIPACRECMVLGGKHWPDCSQVNEPPVKLYRKRSELAALDGVIGGQTGNTAVTMPVGELPDLWGHGQSDTGQNK